MKILDLIEKLKEYPQDWDVLVNGYENGYDNFVLKIVDVNLVKGPSYDGSYQYHNAIDCKRVLVLQRTK